MQQDRDLFIRHNLTQKGEKATAKNMGQGNKEEYFFTGD